MRDVREAMGLSTTDDAMTDAAIDLAHPSPEPKPLARVYGEAFNELPHDLYIPPEALEVFLESFEGPLDLLLYLIRRQNINVLDIPMAELTRQYLGYVEMMRRTQLELAAEYLLMAAVLIEIKSRLLLPRAAGAAGRGARGPARRARAPPARIRADEAGRARDRRACRWPSATSRPCASGSTTSRPTRLPDVRPTTCKAAWAGLIQRAQRQPAPPRHARAAVGAQRDEPRAEDAGGRRATRSSPRCSPSTRTSRISW